MKPDKLFELLGDINGEDVKASEEYVSRKKNTIKYLWPALGVAAVIIMAVIGLKIWKSGQPVNVPGSEISDMGDESNINLPGIDTDPTPVPTTDPLPVTDVDIDHLPIEIDGYWEEIVTPGIGGIKAVYPKSYSEGMSAAEFYMSDASTAWYTEYFNNLGVSRPYAEESYSYCLAVMENILKSDMENTVCSPINTYVALAMVAEITDGESRQQILDALGVPDIETLRTRINSIWKSNYIDNPDLKCVLANSIWLNGSEKFDEHTLTLLAGYYHVSSYYGDPENPEMEKALQEWINENTDGLLKDYVGDIQLTPDLIFDIVSTINYKAMWYEEFDESLNTEETFHGVKGDTIVTMMHSDFASDSVCLTDKFTAINLSTTNSGRMYIYLPNNGYDVNDLLSDPDVLAYASYSSEWDWRFEHIINPIVHLTLPKFKVTGETDLIEMMKSMGITDVFDPVLSDFSPLATDRNDIYLQTATHSAVVEIDEEGITGAAYTELPFGMGGPGPEDEMDIVINRPFVFVITGMDGSVLFSGAVRNI